MAVGAQTGGALPVDRRRRALRVVRDALRRGLLDLRFATLLAWHAVIGPPRLLAFDPEINARLLRAFGASVGRDNVRLEPPITLKLSAAGCRRLSIADDCVLSGNTFLDLTKDITLGRGVSLGPGVTVMTHNAFNGNPFLHARLARMVGSGPVVIGAGAGIKAHAIILHGVTIGEEAVVAGGALVNRDVPRRAFVAGVPAVVKRMLDEEA